MRIFKNTKIDFIGNRKIPTGLSLLIIIGGLASLIMNGGPALSIDFTGGTIAQIQFKEDVAISDLRASMKGSTFDGSEIIEFGSPKEILIKTQFSGSASQLSEDLKQAINREFEVRRVESVGPKIGKELQSDARNAILLALLLIGIYIAFRFDRFYAYGSVAALVHDVIITLGIFSLLKIEIDLTIVAAFLTIVGYSLNDTIVVFDRIRENMIKHGKKTIEEIVNISLNGTLGRTVVTSLTTMIVVVILFFVGGEVIKNFALALIIGVLVGTYSSIYIASPVMIHFERKSAAKK